ncbi:polysaccharide deacetylase family protein [Deinococcus sp. KNUC1210]|uniref:polysaccharide deacetylase family protein n=1 Tax=Deinococcus sp. KNUC1210 TaxID=2917691 RepID=UPI001EF12EC9|nr:polysaccharide deacetylase family protein [Deinococcus sp. KNUC1210]ULH14506.1 polysaccharide deacetylase family protein [Deinococcus sp. KNUC1210]
MRVALWDVESHDWTDRDPVHLAQQMLAQLRPGSVLLLHDGPAPTLALLEHLLPALKKRGLEAVVLTEVQPQRIGWAAGMERLKRMWQRA